MILAQVPQGLRPRNWLIEVIVFTVLLLISLSAVSGVEAGGSFQRVSRGVVNDPLGKAKYSWRYSDHGHFAEPIATRPADHQRARRLCIGCNEVDRPFCRVGESHRLFHLGRGSTAGKDGRCYAMVSFEPDPNLRTDLLRPIAEGHSMPRSGKANRATVRSTDYPS